jgi:tRNA threonylcarbamoyladenosine biosynthesis protein TsaE
MIRPMRWTCLTRSEAQTEQLGRLLAGALHPGMVLGLVGPLGAGKTRLVKAIAQGLGFDPEDVSSPTFVLIQEYSAGIPLYHFDTYRLRDLEEFLELGAEELLEGEGVCLIEWADRVAGVLPADALWIEIRLLSPVMRAWEFRGAGANPERVVSHLRAQAKAAGLEEVPSP